MGFEKGNPFEKLVLGDSISFAELFNGAKYGKVFTEDAQDKEQTVAGVRDDGIGKDGMCMVQLSQKTQRTQRFDFSCAPDRKSMMDLP